MQNLKHKLIKLDHYYSEKIYQIGLKTGPLRTVINLTTEVYGILPFVIIGVLITQSRVLSLFMLICILLINFFVVENFLKPIFARNRPKYDPDHTSGQSFPSTHAATSTMLFLHMILTPSVYHITPGAIVALVVSYLFILISRVIYGHHYIADVVAGIITGVILILPFLLTLR